MAIVTELDLPVFDYADPALGERFHPTMNGLREQGWVAAAAPCRQPRRARALRHHRRALAPDHLTGEPDDDTLTGVDGLHALSVRFHR
jgi:hypothetical protein